MTGHASTGGAIMRNADGTDMTKAQVLIKRRGAFKWLPALFSNDLVHGSWWFVAGSAAMTLFALVPLCQQYIPFYEQHDDLLPSADFTVTWTLMVFSGFFFTLGSAAFVRAFAEPTKQPLFWYNKHFQTDELLGAWMFLWGTVPGVPYTLVFFIVDPTSVFLGAVGISIVMVMGSLLFVVACYPSDKKRNNYVLPFCLRYCGANMWVVKHLANDWLAGTWFFLIANGIGCFISFVMLFEACASGNQETIFIWLSGSIECWLFLIGSLYFVAGSYPHASQFYYAAGRNATGQTFEESQGIVVSRIDQVVDKKKHVPKIDVGIGKKGSLQSQQMEGRVAQLSQSVSNPMHGKVSNSNAKTTTPAKMSIPRPQHGASPASSRQDAKGGEAAGGAKGNEAEANGEEQVSVAVDFVEDVDLEDDEEDDDENDDDDDDEAPRPKPAQHQHYVAIKKK